MGRKTQDMTADMIRAGALRAPKTMSGGHGVRVVSADSGEWLAYPAKSEETKRWRKVCINDLRNRELRGGSFKGDVGHCVIGGKKFSLYPYSGMLVRDDFSLWLEAHFDEFWDERLHRERIAEKKQDDAPISEETYLEMSKKVRRKADKIPAVTDVLEPDSWNTLYEMKHAMANYCISISASEKRGQLFIGTKLLADHLAATIAYREGNYADSIDFYLDMAAAALKAAQFVQKTATEGKDPSNA